MVGSRGDRSHRDGCLGMQVEGRLQHRYPSPRGNGPRNHGIATIRSPPRPCPRASRWRCAGELDDERGSRAWLAFAPDRAAVVLDDFAADVETEAEPTVLLFRDGALEAAEDPVALVYGDADTVIVDREPCGAALGADGDLDRFAGPELDGIGEEIGYDPIETGAIPSADDGCAGLERHRAVGARKIGLEAFVDLADECAEVDVRSLQRERTRIDTRDVEQIADEPGKPGFLV